jgi:predicted amidohydrolase
MHWGTIGGIFVVWIGIGLFNPSGLAAAPGVHPEDWELIAEAQDGRIAQIDVKDGWVAWTEARPDPQTAMKKFQSFYFSAYRKQLGRTNIETLIPPKSYREWKDEIFLGHGGIVCHDYSGRLEPTLYPPGLSESCLLYDPTDRDHYDLQLPLFDRRISKSVLRNKPVESVAWFSTRPARIYPDRIVCVSYDSQSDGISLIPMQDGRPLPDHKMTLLEPTERRIREVFWNGRMLLFGDNEGCYLFDTSENQQRMAWRYGHRNPIPLSLTQEYLYFRITRILSVPEFFRYPVAGGKIERMILPMGMMDILDFVPERVQGILQIGKDYVWVEIDMRTGIIGQYDLSVPRDWFLKLDRRIRNDRFMTRTFDVIPRDELPNPTKQTGESTRFVPFVVASDAATGDLIAVYANRIYRIGRRKAEPETWASFGWNTTISKEVKQGLHLTDGDGKEVVLFPQETFIAAAIQAHSEMAKPKENRDHLVQLALEAFRNGAQVIVLPETAVTGYMSYDIRTTWQADVRELSEDLNGKNPKEFAEISHRSAEAFRQYGLGTVFRTVPFLEIDTTTGLYFNSVTLYPPSRSKDDIAAGKPQLKPLTYRKLNPWPYAERGWATKGDQGLAVVDTEFGRMALLICYDINFEPPNLKAKGIDHLLYSIAWVENKDSDWFERQLPRIARENDFNIIAANWTVPDGFKPDWYGYGQSRIIDRKGVILSKTDRDIGEKIVYAELPIVKREKAPVPVR